MLNGAKINEDEKIAITLLSRIFSLIPLRSNAIKEGK